MRETLKSIFNFFMPKKCYFCGKFTNGEDICAECMASLPWREKADVKIEYAQGCYAPLKYQGKVRKAILRFKFKSVQQMDKCFARILVDCVTQCCPGEFDYITWVPVNFLRKQKRRYDQVYLIARQVSKIMNVPCKRFLVKGKNIAPQYTMVTPSQRTENVTGAYRAVSERNLVGKRILLIDDIVTTGSTLNECNRLLLLAGAESVVCLCLAKTERKL